MMLRIVFMAIHFVTIFTYFMALKPLNRLSFTRRTFCFNRCKGFKVNLQMKSEGQIPYESLISTRTTKEFLKLLRITAFNVKSPLPRLKVVDIADDADFRLNAYSIPELCECFWYLNNLKVVHESEEIVMKINYVRTAIKERLNTEGIIFCDSSSRAAVVDFLDKLVHIEDFRWTDMPIGFQESLLNKVSTLLDVGDDHLLVTVADIIISFGKLSLDWKFVNTRFKLTLMKFIVGNYATYDEHERSLLHAQSISKLIYGLHLMKARWIDLSIETQIALSTACIYNLHHMNEISVTNMLSALGKMGAKWGQFPIALKNAFHVHIERVSFFMNSAAVANTFLALGKLGAQWKHLPTNLKLALCERLVSLHPIGLQALSSSIMGLSRLQVSWDDLSPNFREALQESFPDDMKGEISEQTVANIIWGLGGLRVRWGLVSEKSMKTLQPLVPKGNSDVDQFSFQDSTISLPIPVTSKLLKMISKVSSRLTDQGLSNILWGLAKMNIDWAKDVPIDIRTQLFEVIHNKIRLGIHSTGNNDRERVVSTGVRRRANFEAQSVANLVWSLGQFQVVWNGQRQSAIVTNMDNKGGTYSQAGDATLALTEDFRLALSAAVQSTLSSATEQGLVNILSGLAKMHAKKHQIPVETMNSLLQKIVSMSPQMKIQGISNVLWALSALEFAWQDVPRPVRMAIENAAMKQADLMVPRSLSIIITALAKMGVNWTFASAGDNILKISPASVTRILKKSFGRDDSSSGSGADKLDIDVSNRNKMPILCWVCLSSLSRCAPNMKNQETANTVHGLGRLGIVDAHRYLRNSSFNYSLNQRNIHLSVSERDVLIEAIVRTADSMSEQELGNTIWGLGQIGIGYTVMQAQLRSVLYSAILRRREQLQKQAVVAILQGLAKPGDLRWSELPTDLRQTLLGGAERFLPDVYYSFSHYAELLAIPRRNSSASLSRIDLFDASPAIINDYADDVDVVVDDDKITKRDPLLASTIIYALGYLQADWNSLDFTDRLRLKLLGNLVVGRQEDCVKISINDVYNYRKGLIMSTAMNGLARMGIPWCELRSFLMSSTGDPDRIRHDFANNASNDNDRHNITIIGELSASMADMSANELAHTLWGLGRVRAVWREIPSQLQQVLQSKLSQRSAQMTAYEVAWSFWALGCMSVHWQEDLQMPLRNVLLKSADGRSGNMSQQEVGVLLWSLTRMQAQVNDFPLSIRQLFYEDIESRLITRKA